MEMRRHIVLTRCFNDQYSLSVMLDGIGDEAVSKREERTMIDWNRDGKIDGWDHGFTAFLIDEANGKTASGCCGTTVAMFLIGIILPVVLAVVFMAHA